MSDTKYPPRPEWTLVGEDDWKRLFDDYYRKAVERLTTQRDEARKIAMTNIEREANSIAKLTLRAEQAELELKEARADAYHSTETKWMNRALEAEKTITQLKFELKNLTLNWRAGEDCCDQRDAAKAETERMKAALIQISKWDMINPGEGRSQPLADGTWLKTLIADALIPEQPYASNPVTATEVLIDKGENQKKFGDGHCGFTEGRCMNDGG